MTEKIARMATTGIIEQGDIKVIMSKESLESTSEEINGNRAVPFTVGHDPSCPPIGKIVETWVEPYEHGHALMARVHVEDGYENIVHTALDTQLIRLDFQDAPKPFIREYENAEQNELTVKVDSVNFDSIRDLSKFEGDVGQIDEEIICKNLGRYAIEPEPIIQLILANPQLSATLTWVAIRAEKFLRYTVDETLKKVGDDIADSLSSKIKSVLTAYRNHQSEDDRPVLIQIVIHGDLDLVLLMPIASDHEFQNIDMAKLAEAMEKSGDFLQCAEEATFAYISNNNWEFQHAKTRTGKVITTLENYEKTVEKSQGITAISIGISLDIPKLPHD